MVTVEPRPTLLPGGGFCRTTRLACRGSWTGITRWSTWSPRASSSARATRGRRPPSQVQVPDLIGRRPRVARAELEALGLQVNEAQVPVQDPRQANRVVLQNPPPGSTVGPGSTVTIVVGVGFRND